MLLLAALFASALAEEPAAAPSAPEVATEGFVLRPTFHMGEDKKVPAGGVAFAVEREGARYALTAYQLLGPPSGIEQVAPAEVKKVSKVALAELSGTWLANAGSPAKTTVEVVGSTASKDVLVLALPKPKDLTATLTTGNRATLKPGALASEAPKKGDPVWLVAPLPNAPGAGALHRGTVAEINGDFLFYDVADSGLDLAGTSGAPLVNAQGEVVGMQVGVIRFEDGGLAGSAVPLSALEARLAEAAE